MKSKQYRGFLIQYEREDLSPKEKGYAYYLSRIEDEHDFGDGWVKGTVDNMLEDAYAYIDDYHERPECH